LFPKPQNLLLNCPIKLQNAVLPYSRIKNYPKPSNNKALKKESLDISREVKPNSMYFSKNPAYRVKKPVE